MPPEFPIMAVVWAVLILVGYFAFGKNSSYDFKKKWYPLYNLLIGFLFVLFVILMEFPIEAFYLVIPGVILITFINIKMNIICPSCGNMSYNAKWISSKSYCPKCGNYYEGQEPPNKSL